MVSRRGFLAGVLGLSGMGLSGAVLTGCERAPAQAPRASHYPAGSASGVAVGAAPSSGLAASKAPTLTTRPGRPLPVTTSMVYAPAGVISELPAGSGNAMAWTVDDGVDSAVVGSYLDFIKASGIRLTFFVNGCNPSWTEHAPTLRPLVESGQVLLANHTWSHPDITQLSDRQVMWQVERNRAFLHNTYGVDGRPFFRPPYGFHNARTDRLIAEAGYPTITMWYGTLGDAAVIGEDTELALANEWFRPGRIVIGHANHPGVTHLFPQLLQLIGRRQLHPITLADAYQQAPH